jgi:hypothetical protein
MIIKVCLNNIKQVNKTVIIYKKEDCKRKEYIDWPKK